MLRPRSTPVTCAIVLLPARQSVWCREHEKGEAIIVGTSSPSSSKRRCRTGNAPLGRHKKSVFYFCPKSCQEEGEEEDCVEAKEAEKSREKDLEEEEEAINREESESDNIKLELKPVNGEKENKVYLNLDIDVDSSTPGKELPPTLQCIEDQVQHALLMGLVIDSI